MNLKTRHIGFCSGESPSKIIELIIESSNNVITEDITNLNGSVDLDFIISLREIANELEDQNSNVLKTSK